MDYCAGGDLSLHLAKSGCFSEDVSRFYIAELILAIEYLHNLNILYRDLKPENILLGDYLFFFYKKIQFFFHSKKNNFFLN